ncbi:MAG: SWIM zinc finger family protein [Chloroflexota bacterium]|nr:SWIM zinc finger family protein [Chloroflexota bacterium]
METVPQLSEDTVRARFDAQSWQRGRQYARDGAIINARRQGMALKASCIGSMPEPYRVEVTFKPRGIASADCTCPVGEEGYCKHVAALLITWLNRPEAFREAEETDAALQRRDKDELIALIEQMIRRYPDLESLLDMPLVVGGKASQPINRAVFHRQIIAAFHRGGYEWRAEIEIAREIVPLVEIADTFLQQRDYTNATTAYEAISSAMLDQYGTYNDEDGALQEIIFRCVEGLIDALSGLTVAPETRAAILPALFAIYHADIESGRSELSGEIASTLVDLLTDAERRTVAEWVRMALPSGKSWNDDYHRQAYGAFLLDLETDTLDDEAFIRLCRETSRTDDLIERLLTLNRVEEAEHEAREVSDYHLLGLADRFVAHKQQDVAERLIQERAATSQDSRVTEWLMTYDATHGNDTGALELALKLFQIRPELAIYKEIRRLAGKIGTWETLHVKLLASLQQGDQTTLLVSIYLEEGELDRAIDCVLKPKKQHKAAGIPFGYPYLSGSQTALTVAKAAEATRPKSAREIYQQHIESLIAGRNRESYRQACGYLVTVRELYDRLDDYEGWEQYLAGLREKYRTLRALKEELTTAGLLD